MGSRRHPLDIFKSTEKGFNHATRQRRTIVGKVLASTIRSGKDDGGKSPSRGPGLLGAKARPTKKKEGRARKVLALSPAAARADALGRKLIYGLGVAFVLVALVFALRSTFIDDGPEQITSLSSDSLRGDPVADDGVGVHTILAASYGASEDALRLAYAAHDELLARGFEDVLVVEVAGPQGGIAGYQLIVGRAHASALGDLRRSLRSLDDWPYGDGQPFSGANIRAHPLEP